jgi:transcriptional regulator with XRE-family HTH domain
METAQTRIKSILEALHTTANAFAREHGMNAPTLYGFINGTRSPGFEILSHICESEPRISAEFLLRGAGEPLLDKRRANNLSTIEELSAFKADIDESIDRRIAELRTTVNA